MRRAPSRWLFVGALALVGCAPLKPEAKPAATPGPGPRAVRQSEIPGMNLSAARELDQQGAKLYGEGRFREAARYFEEASERGGPPSELWNMARCQQKLDDLEGAARLLERYLEHTKLTASEREDARRELAEVQRKPSRVTVISTPPGATVLVDERRAPAHASARTPLTFELPPGDHVLTLELSGYDAETERVTARYGRSIVVETTLSK